MIEYCFPEKIGVSLYQLIPGASEEAIQFIENCLKYSSRKRSNMLELLKLDFFKGVNLVAEPEKKEVVFETKQGKAGLDTS